MDREKIERLRASWERLQIHGPELAASFYSRLFQLDPKLKDLFAITEMDSQNKKFMSMMSELVDHAEDEETLVALLRASGRRHRGYGVVSRDYLTVGESFLWALDHAVPGGLLPEERTAWAQAYTFMSSVMSGAAGD